MIRALVSALSVTTVLLLSACGSDHGGHSESDAASVPASADHNEADVTFATDMVPHHAQALAMVDLTRGRDLSPELQQVVSGIEQAQAPEIEQMTGWLQEWDQPVPDTGRGHEDGHGDHSSMGDMGDMPGMMSEDEMTDLEDAQGEQFEQMFLQMMIEHHEGAIEMAQTETKDGEYADAIALSKEIATGQAQEIETMKALLKG